MLKTKLSYAIVAAFTVNFIIGLQYAFSAFVEPLEEMYGWSRAEISLAFTIMVSLLNTIGIFVGYYIDKYGPKNIASIGAVITSMGFIATSYMMHLLEFYIYFGFLVGAGSGILYMSNLSVASRVSKRRRGTGIGFVVSGFGLSAAFFGPFLTYLISVFGLRATYRFLGLLSLLLILPLTRTYNVEAYNNVKRGGYFRTLFNIIKTKRFIILWLTLALASSAGFAVSSSIKPYLESFVESSIIASLAITVFAIGNTSGRIIAGTISDVIGSRRALILLMSIHGMNMLLLLSNLFPIPLMILFIGAYIVGLGHGSLFAIYPKLTTEIFGIEKIGVAYGAVLTSSTLGSFFGAYITGLVYDIFKTYSYAFIFSGALVIVSLIIIIMLFKKE